VMTASAAANTAPSACAARRLARTKMCHTGCPHAKVRTPEQDYRILRGRAIE
jgi:hypothetical protein